MKITKKSTVIVLLILLIILCIFGIFFIFGHNKLNKEFSEKYYPLFNFEFIEHIDLLNTITYSSRDNIITFFPFYPHKDAKKRIYDNPAHFSDTLYSISILEFKHLNQLSLNDIVINYKENLNLISTNYTWESLGAESNIPVSFKYGVRYHNFKINLDRKNKTLSDINGKYYKGFIGMPERVVISNQDNTPGIIFEHIPPWHHALYLIYNKDDLLYLIRIQSKTSLNNNILEIFNLE